MTGKQISQDLEILFFIENVQFLRRNNCREGNKKLEKDMNERKAVKKAASQLNKQIHD